MIELVDTDHFHIETLSQVSPQAGHLHRVAKPDHLFELRMAVNTRVVTNGSLNFGQQIVEDRSHRLEELLGIFRLGRMALQVLGLREGKLQFLGQRLGKVVATQRDATLPNAEAVGDNQVGRIGTEREDNRRGRRIVRHVFLDRRKIIHLIEEKVVVKCKRGKLDEINFDTDFVERFERTVDLIPLHGEQADLGFENETLGLAATAHALVVPDDVVQIERDLLLRFIFDNVGDLLRLDWRKLDETRETILSRYGDRDNGRP